MENIKNLSKALCQAQSEMSNAKKGTANNFFKSKYADLNAIREAVIPILNAHGITVLQPIVHVDGKNFIKTILLHETGESLDSHIEIVYSKQNDAQSQGSGITYARRYALQSFVCVGAEDDDGNDSSNTNEPITDNLVWMSQKQFEQAKSNVEMAKKALSFYDGKTEHDGKVYGMKKEFRSELEKIK